MPTSFLDIVDPDDRRHSDFREWTVSVRDPATMSSDGLRTVTAASGGASAAYEIAPLPDGRFAVRFRIEYSSGSMYGHACPWTAFSTRDECLDHFLQAARSHFSAELVASNCSTRQRLARREMLELLGGGLFDFLEPSPGRPAGTVPTAANS